MLPHLFFGRRGAANVCSFRAWDLNNHHAEQRGEVEAPFNSRPLVVPAPSRVNRRKQNYHQV